jgi:hypothetical protein
LKQIGKRLTFSHAGGFAVPGHRMVLFQCNDKRKPTAFRFLNPCLRHRDSIDACAGSSFSQVLDVDNRSNGDKGARLRRRLQAFASYQGE